VAFSSSSYPVPCRDVPNTAPNSQRRARFFPFLEAPPSFVLSNPLRSAALKPSFSSSFSLWIDPHLGCVRPSDICRFCPSPFVWGSFIALPFRRGCRAPRSSFLYVIHPRSLAFNFPYPPMLSHPFCVHRDRVAIVPRRLEW